MELSITQAAQTFKTTRQTIHAKIRKGELSKNNNDKIDVSEMVRVFGEPSSRNKKRLTVDTSILQGETAILQQRIQHLEEQERTQRERAERAERQADQFLNEVKELSQTIRLLEAPKKESKGFLSRFF
jgi:predicted transcriptional regulator